MFNYTPTRYRDTQNRRLLRGIFLEYTTDRDSAIYSIQDKDREKLGKPYPSLYRLYLEMEDLTEYQFALKYMESWEHWQMLCECTWFQPYLTRWRTELELKLKAQALQNLLLEARDGGKNCYNANKFLIEKGWIDKSTEPKRRGRPSKAEIAREAAEQVFNHNQIADDYKRLELKEVN